MNNYKKPGDVLTLTAPAGGVTSGGLYFVGAMAVIAANAAAAAASFEGHVVGVFELAKATGVAWTEGQPLYWDVASAEASTDPSAGPFVGNAAAVAASAAALGNVRLNGASVAGSGALQVRKRFTIAQVNAGATVVPAVAGRKLRMVDAIMIAIGGAVAVVTTVDLLGTQTGAAKLIAAAQAGLTQSAVVRAGDATGAVLADGASFVANDAGTPITVGITGGDITTATHIDVILTYAIDE